VRIDTAGEKIFVVDDRGRTLDGGMLLASMAELMLRGTKGATIAVPVNAPSAVETVTKRAGGKLVYTKVLPSALMGVATRDSMRLVGDGAGGFIFPELQPAFDGMFAIVKLLEALARYNTRMSEVVDNLPPYHLIRVDVNCPWEYKGKVMRILSEQYRERREEPIDGIKIDLGKEWVLVLPDADRPLFHVLAESRSRDAAQALADKYARVVTGLQH
jgi:mannose-1-phosphate guanylyltransferase/phosphomannomutase